MTHSAIALTALLLGVVWPHQQRPALHAPHCREAPGVARSGDPYHLQTYPQLDSAPPLPKRVLFMHNSAPSARPRNQLELYFARPQPCSEVWSLRFVPMLTYTPQLGESGPGFQVQLGLFNGLRVSNSARAAGVLPPGSRYANETRCLSALRVCF